MFPRIVSRRLRTLGSVLGMVIAIPIAAFAQEPSSNLGLPAVAAFGFHGGVARLERSSDGQEAGALLDLGWIRGRSLRLQGEVAFLRASLTEHMELEDSTFVGDYFDLSAGVTAIWHAAADGQVSP